MKSSTQSCRFTLSSLALLLSSCGAAPTQAPKVEHPPADADASPAFSSPAHWAYFPRDAGTTLATLVLPASSAAGKSAPSCLVLTTSSLSNGDRWLVRGSSSAPCVGIGVASASPVLGEALVSAQKTQSGYRFISASGTVYDSNEPLGAFTRTTTPEQRLGGVSSAGSSMVGADAAGRVYYFDDGAGAWKRASVPPGTRVLRAGVDASGRAVAIALPEKLLTSTDGGRSYTSPATSPPHIGASGVVRTSAGELVVVGMMGKLLWEKSGAFTATTIDVAPPVEGETGITASLSPQASAFREGRAQIAGDQYYDLRYPDSAAGPQVGVEAPMLDNSGAPPAYVLVRGPLAGPLESRPLKGVQDCDDLKLGAHGKNVVVACSFVAPDETSGMGVHLFESTNAGDEFASIGDLVTPSFSDVYVAVGGDGGVLVTNACKRSSTGTVRPAGTGRGGTDDGPEVCKPKGPVYVKLAGGKTAIVAGNAAHFAYGAFAPAISPDGRLYFIGRRAKDDRAAVFLSTDGGKTFDDHTLDAPPPSDDTGTDDSGSDAPPPTDFGYLELSPEYSRLTVDESGTLGLVAETQAGYTWVTADADVHLLNIGVPPEQAVLAGFGKRVVAIGYGTNDSTTHAYESMDGGASFSEIATTEAMTSFNQGDTMTICGAGGCLLGDTLARIGWEGESESTDTVPDGSVPETTGKLGASIACELTPKTAWTQIKNPVVGGLIYPRLSDMNRGKTAWSLITQDPVTRAVDVTTASVLDKESDPSSVTTQRLMGPIQAGAKTALVVKTQEAEGYIAARVAIPGAKGKLDTTKPINGLEVNWANFYTGTIGHRTLADAGAWSPTMLALPNIHQTQLTETTFQPALLSIAGSGVVFRASTASARSLFFDAGAQTTPFDYPDWGALGLTVGINGDAAMGGAQLFAAGFVRGSDPDGTQVSVGFARAHKPANASAFQAETTTFGTAAGEAGWVYLDSASGPGITYPDADGVKGEAFALILKPDGSLGDPIALPTLNDLPDKPRACTADDRKNTPRSYMPVFSKSRTPAFPNGRRAIMLTEGAKDPKSLTVTEPQWFLSDGAIMYGTRKDPCLAGLRASSPGHGLVAIIAGDMTHAWVFRPARSAEECGCDPSDPLCDCSAQTAPKRQQGRSRPKAAPRPRPATTSSVEWRPMTCRVKPDLTPPPDVSANVLIQSPEDMSF